MIYIILRFNEISIGRNSKYCENHKTVILVEKTANAGSQLYYIGAADTRVYHNIIQVTCLQCIKYYTYLCLIYTCVYEILYKIGESGTSLM